MQTKRENYLIFLPFIFSFLLLFLDLNSKVVFLHSGVGFFANPVQSRLFDIKSFVVSPFMLFGAGDKEKVNQLELKVAQLNSQIAAYKSLEEENTKMRRLLGADVSPNWQFFPARVVWGDADSVTITADVDIKKETPVLATSDDTKGGVLVGRVENVYGGNYKVFLPSSPNMKISVSVRGANGDKHANGIIEGKGGKIVLSQVLGSDVLEEGDLVLTSGDSGFPPNLLIGYVNNIATNTNFASKEAEVTSAVKVSELDYVFFVTKF